MNKIQDQRTERRLHYNWSIRFADGFDSVLSQGQMVDISSSGGCFTCPADKYCPSLKEQITTLFSVPRFGSDGSFDMANYNRTGKICRVEQITKLTNKIAIQFNKPLFFKPGEQGISESEEKIV